MCRTITILMALLALAMTPASGAPVTSATPHGRSPYADRAHAVHSKAAPHHLHRTAGERSSRTRIDTRARRAASSRSRSDAAVETRSSQPDAHRQTPEEVGREAGLKIRRTLEERRRARERAARYTEHSRADRRVEMSRSRSVERVRSASETHAAEEQRAEDARRKVGSEPDEQAPRRSAAEIAAAARSTLSNAPREHAAAASAQPAESSMLAADTLATQERIAALQAQTEQASLHFERRGAPLPLRGSLASLERQDERLQAEGLERIEDEADLSGRIAHKLLVPIPVSAALIVNPDLPVHHRYCRPWTAQFLADLARAHEAVFHRPIKVNSAVRTVAYQERLMRINGNAAPAEGNIVSPHLMGATVDIAKEGMTLQELAWMRRRLLALEAVGKIDVEEEFQQACFHITVYREYAPATGRRLAQGHSAPRPAHRRTADPSIAGEMAAERQ